MRGWSGGPRRPRSGAHRLRQVASGGSPSLKNPRPGPCWITSYLDLEPFVDAQRRGGERGRALQPHCRSCCSSLVYRVPATIAAPFPGRLGWDLEEGGEPHPARNVAKMAADQPLNDDDADRGSTRSRSGVSCTWSGTTRNPLQVLRTRLNALRAADASRVRRSSMRLQPWGAGPAASRGGKACAG